MATTKRQTEKAAAIERLQALLQPRDTVYTILRHVSSSGMTRHISVVMLRKSEPLYLNDDVAKALGETLVDTHGYQALKISGIGMDRGFSVVYELGRVLYPDGFKTPKGYSRNTPLAHEPDGGYAFNHQWL